MYFIVKRSSFVEEGRVEFSQDRISNTHGHSTDYFPSSQDGHSNHSSSFQIAFFGIVGILHVICYLVKVHMEHKMDVELLNIINNGAALGCIILAIIFLCQYKGASLKGCRFFQYSIASMIGVDAWIWVFITVEPLNTLSIDNSSIFEPSDFSLHLNSTTVLEIAESLLHPFLVEFLSISAGCLLSLWFTMRDDPKSHIEYERLLDTSTRINGHDENLQDYGALLDQSESQIGHATSSTSHKYLKYIVIAASVVMAIGYWTAVEILLFGPFSSIAEKSLSNTTRSVLTKFIQGVVYLPMIVMNFISLHKLQRSSDSIPQMKHFTTSDLLLLITSAGFFVYKVLRSITSLNIFIDDREPEYIVYLIISIGSIVQIWAQTQFIMTAHYVQRSVQRLPKSAQFTLIYVAAINLADWLYLTVVHKWIENDPALNVFNPEFVSSFGNLNTAILLLILNPVLEMYRFHSVVVAYESLQIKQH